jgi:branched-chain amino acid transport system permease protein
VDAVAPPRHWSAGAGRLVLRLAVLAAGGALLLSVPMLLDTPYYQGIAVQALVFVVLAVGYDLVLGYTGQISFGHIALFAIGAYTSALLTTDAGWPFLPAVLAAAVVAGAVGALIGFPALRVRSHYLALFTLAFAEVTRLLLLNLDGLTGGARGVRGIPAPSIGSLELTTRADQYYLVLAVALLAVLVLVQLDRSRFGRAFKAVRDSEIGADVSGVVVLRVKVLAFGISAIYAGVAGALYAHTMRYISPDFFSLGLVVTLLAMVLIGGRGTVAGAAVGAVALTFLPELLRFVQEYYMIVFGLTLWLVTLLAPEGVTGLVRRGARHR